jgi:hypothetical protein
MIKNQKWWDFQLVQFDGFLSSVEFIYGLFLDKN